MNGKYRTFRTRRKLLITLNNKKDRLYFVRKQFQDETKMNLASIGMMERERYVVGEKGLKLRSILHHLSNMDVANVMGWVHMAASETRSPVTAHRCSRMNCMKCTGYYTLCSD